MCNGTVHFLLERKRSKIALMTARRHPPPKHSTSLIQSPDVFSAFHKLWEVLKTSRDRDRG